MFLTLVGPCVLCYVVLLLNHVNVFSYVLRTLPLLAFVISYVICFGFFFSSRRRHTRCLSDWSSDVCSSDLGPRTRRRGGSRPPAARATGAAGWPASSRRPRPARWCRRAPPRRGRGGRRWRR